MSYEKLRGNKKDMLESDYIRCMALGDSAGMYKILSEMQKYRLIEEDDSRLDKQSLKRFESDGVDTKTSVYKDYRDQKVKSSSSFTGYVYTNHLPDNLIFGSIPFTYVTIKNIGYWGERRELQYRGDIIIPEKEHKYVFNSDEELGKATGTVSRMADLYKKQTGKEMTSAVAMKKLVESGQIKMASIKLGNGEEFSVKELGCMFINSSGKNKIQCKIILNIEDCIKHRIMLKTAYDTIANALYGALKEHNDKLEIEIDHMTKLDEAIKKQKEMRSREIPLDANKFCEIENRKLEAEAEEKASMA